MTRWGFGGNGVGEVGTEVTGAIVVGNKVKGAKVTGDTGADVIGGAVGVVGVKVNPESAS